MLATDRRREIFFALAVLLPVIAIGLGAEIGMRYRESTITAVDWRALRAAIGTATPDGVALLHPNSRFGAIRINSLGYRGPELAIPAPPGTVRLAFVGDSKVLAADLPEAATLPAQTVARLARARPQCRFDYVAIAGPGLGMKALGQLWYTDAPRLAPDFAVILAGGANDLMGQSEAAAAPPPTGLGALLAQSAIVRLASRELRMVSPATPASPAVTQSLAQLATIYRRELAPLVAAIGPTPTIAIGYRSRLGDSTSSGAAFTVARHLRQSFPGLSLAKAVAMSELVVSEMRRQARQSGWRFVDPIAAIDDEPRHFTDRSHFSPSGIAHIADAVTAEILADLGPDPASCTVRRGPERVVPPNSR